MILTIVIGLVGVYSLTEGQYEWGAFFLILFVLLAGSEIWGWFERKR